MKLKKSLVISDLSSYYDWASGWYMIMHVNMHSLKILLAYIKAKVQSFSNSSLQPVSVKVLPGMSSYR